MSSPRFSMLVATHVFLIRDDQILLTRRFQTGYEDGKYSLPAGHVEAGETALRGCIRETREEIGVTLTVDALECAHVMHRRSNDERIDFFFVCREWQEEPFNAEPEKCDDVRWSSLDDLPENMVPYVRFAIQQWRSGQHYSEFGWK